MTNFRVFLNLVVSKRGAHAGTQQPFLASNPTGCGIVKNEVLEGLVLWGSRADGLCWYVQGRLEFGCVSVTFPLRSQPQVVSIGFLQSFSTRLS